MGHSLALVVPAVLWLGAAVSEVSLVPYLIRFYLEGDQRMNCLEVYQLPAASPKFCPDKKLRGIPSCLGERKGIFVLTDCKPQLRKYPESDTMRSLSSGASPPPRQTCSNSVFLQPGPCYLGRTRL